MEVGHQCTSYVPSHIRPYFSRDSFKTAFHASVTFRLNYSNSFFAGLSTPISMSKIMLLTSYIVATNLLVLVYIFTGSLLNLVLTLKSF